MHSVLIVGAGFTGAVLAERFASQLGRRVLLIDQRNHIAGNAFDRFDDHGVMVHAHGPHIFHTNSQVVVDYLSHFTRWRRYQHRVRGYVNGQFVPIPFNFTSMTLIFGRREGTRINKLLADEFGTESKVPVLKMRQSNSSEVRRISDFIYENVFLNYSLKQWSLRPEELDPSVSARVPVLLSHDDRYFQDVFQCMPADGYTVMFQRILDHPLIEVRTGTRFADAVRSETFGRIIYTGPIDEFFDHRHGHLPYRSIRFKFKTTRRKQPIQKTAIENYPTPPMQHAYTRSTEYRLLTGQEDVSYTTQAFEYPEPYTPSGNQPYYPIPRDVNRALYGKYKEEAAKLEAVTFAGRLADYKYYNMDQATARALAVFAKLAQATEI